MPAEEGEGLLGPGDRLALGGRELRRRVVPGPRLGGVEGDLEGGDRPPVRGVERVGAAAGPSGRAERVGGEHRLVGPRGDGVGEVTHEGQVRAGAVVGLVREEPGREVPVEEAHGLPPGGERPDAELAAQAAGPPPRPDREGAERSLPDVPDEATDRRRHPLVGQGDRAEDGDEAHGDEDTVEREEDEEGDGAVREDAEQGGGELGEHREQAAGPEQGPPPPSAPTGADGVARAEPGPEPRGGAGGDEAGAEEGGEEGEDAGHVRRNAAVTAGSSPARPEEPCHPSVMDPDSGAGLLHRLTSYFPGQDWDVPLDDPRIRQDLTPMDPDLRPPQQKAYADGLPRLDLPRDFAAPDLDAAAVLSGDAAPARRLDAAGLGRVLFLGAGIVRTAERPGWTVLFRAAGSAGGRFPLEVYVAARGVDGVPDGVHWYDGLTHSLLRVGPAPEAGATTVVVTGVPWRSGWKYAERAFRHVYWDAGTLLSQLEVAASSGGFDARLWTDFPDADVARLVGADGTHEFPVALLTLEAGVPAVVATGEAVTGALPEVEHALTTAAQRAGDGTVLGDPWPSAAGLGAPPVSAGSVDDLLLRRGSQRLMDRGATLPRSALEWPLAVALRGVDVPHWVVVHAVDGLEPGVYRTTDLEHAVATGELRAELERVCLDQGLAGDAAYVVVGATDTGRLDDRGYRAAQLAAGLVEGRLHLAAYAVGASASGMTFLDTEVPALLGEDPDRLVTLLFTCVGVPEYRSRAGGRPGAPVALAGTRQPRMTQA